LRRFALVALLVLAPGCITRAEYRAGVTAWRSYYDATRPDLETLYGGLAEPSRSTCLGLVSQEDATIHAAEVRAGIAPQGTQ